MIQLHKVTIRELYDLVIQQIRSVFRDKPYCKTLIVCENWHSMNLLSRLLLKENLLNRYINLITWSSLFKTIACFDGHEDREFYEVQRLNAKKTIDSMARYCDNYDLLIIVGFHQFNGLATFLFQNLVQSLPLKETLFNGDPFARVAHEVWMESLSVSKPDITNESIQVNNSPDRLEDVLRQTDEIEFKVIEHRSKVQRLYESIFVPDLFTRQGQDDLVNQLQHFLTNTQEATPQYLQSSTLQYLVVSDSYRSNSTAFISYIFEIGDNNDFSEVVLFTSDYPCLVPWIGRVSRELSNEGPLIDRQQFEVLTIETGVEWSLLLSLLNKSEKFEGPVSKTELYEKVLYYPGFNQLSTKRVVFDVIQRSRNGTTSNVVYNAPRVANNTIERIRDQYYLAKSISAIDFYLFQCAAFTQALQASNWLDPCSFISPSLGNVKERQDYLWENQDRLVGKVVKCCQLKNTSDFAVFSEDVCLAKLSESTLCTLLVDGTLTLPEIADGTVRFMIGSVFSLSSTLIRKSGYKLHGDNTYLRSGFWLGVSLVAFRNGG